MFSSCCLHVLQALFDERAHSTDTATAAQLCPAACLEVAAWQQRMPAAAQLMHASMQPPHILMLLAVMHIAEGGSMDSASQQLAGIDAATDMRDVQQLLLHHGLARQDGYTDVLLRNSAASSTSDHAEQQGAADQQPADVASLLVWVTRNAATASFLSRVLDIACREGQLAAQVRDAVLFRAAFTSSAGVGVGLRRADMFAGALTYVSVCAALSCLFDNRWTLSKAACKASSWPSAQPALQECSWETLQQSRSSCRLLSSSWQRSWPTPVTSACSRA